MIRGAAKPEFYRTPTEDATVLLRSQLHAQEQSFLQREKDWREDLRLSMEREEQFRVRLRELDAEVNIRANSLVEEATVALSVEVEQHRQRVQELEDEVQSLAARLEESNSERVKERLAAVGCDWAGCSDHRNGAWRFCKLHLGQARKEMKDDGYLQSVPWRGGGKRTPEMMEDVNETKYGPLEK